MSRVETEEGSRLNRKTAQELADFYLTPLLKGGSLIEYPSLEIRGEMESGELAYMSIADLGEGRVAVMAALNEGQTPVWIGDLRVMDKYMTTLRVVYKRKRRDLDYVGTELLTRMGRVGEPVWTCADEIETRRILSVLREALDKIGDG